MSLNQRDVANLQKTAYHPEDGGSTGNEVDIPSSCPSICRKSSQNTFGEIVKFDKTLPESVSISDQNVGERLPKDETLRMFACMPKGFENFLESGPSKRVVDYIDYEKLCTMERQKIEYFEEQKEPQENRKKAIHEKQLELQGFCKSFELYVSEYSKKKERAENQSQRLGQQNHELSVELGRLKDKLFFLKRRREKLIRCVARDESVYTFFETILRAPDSQFLDFTAIMHRYITLESTFRYLQKKYNDRHSVYKELEEELQSERNFSRQHCLNLREHITQLKRKLQLLLTENLDLEHHCSLWARIESEKNQTVFNLTKGIQMMAHTLMDVRPFTRLTLAPLTLPCDQIERIGILLGDYKDIVKKFGTNRKQVMPHKTSDAPKREIK